MKIEADYSILCEIYEGHISLHDLDEMQLVSVALCSISEINIDPDTYQEIILEARELCAERLKERIELEYAAGYAALPQFFKDDMQTMTGRWTDADAEAFENEFYEDDGDKSW